MQWTGWALLALGVWLIVAPFALGYSAMAAAVINDGTFGVLIVGLAAYSMVAPRRVAEAFTWLVSAAGLCVAFAPFLLGYAAFQGPDLGQNVTPYFADYPVPAIINDIVVGVSVAILGLVQAVAFRAPRRA